MAVARLARRERFCGAVNFHSFGGVVYLPAAEGSERARHALAAFQGPFQSRQRFLRYRPVPERSATITGQLDAFLLGAFGTPSATVEVSRPGLALLRPGRLPNVFWIANPPDPARWAVLHQQIIERFGRFPHRNPALGRATTAEEQAYLDGGGFKG